MLWIWLPIALLVLIVCLWILVAIVKRRGGDGVPEPGQTVFDRDAARKARQASRT